jgi:hypothetical protein
MSDNGIIDLISPYLKDRDEIPLGYEALTTPCKLSSESGIIRSIFDSLQGTTFFVTLECGKVRFYKRCMSRKEFAGQYAMPTR